LFWDNHTLKQVISRKQAIFGLPVFTISQQVLSPYHAMGCNPVSMVDPWGLQAGLAPGTKLLNFMPPNAGKAYIEGQVVVLGANFMNLEAMRLRASERFTDFLIQSTIKEAFGEWQRVGKFKSAGSSQQTSEGGGVLFNIQGAKYTINYSSGSLAFSKELETVSVIRGKADWIDWGKRMNSRFGNSLGYSFGGYGQSHGFWNDVNDGFSIIWNSPIARRYIPDKISFAIGGDIALGGGVGAQPINFTILTRGKDPGVYLTPTFNTYAGVGAFFSGGVELTISNYTGDPRKITASMVTGETNGGYATGGLLGDFSAGVTYSPATNVHGFLNVSVGIGIGGGAFIGYNYQNTPGYKKF